MDFKKIKIELTENDPQAFLTAVLQFPQEEDSFFIFSQSLAEQFEQNIQYLAASETISMSDLTEWKRQDFLVVAQTIDGDYIAGNQHETWVIPVSLYKTDIERYHLFLTDFFIAYTSNKLQSSILPNCSA